MGIIIPRIFGGRIKGFVIAATGSGTGKTTITLAVLSWLARRGVKVAPFKVGPDFIDPGHHTKIAGRNSFNLDSWMLPRDYNQDLFQRKTKGMDMALVEGVMGLFDGYDALTETGSTAQMAKWLGLPVVLVVSAKGKARSAAALVKGFEEFDPGLTLAGVIFSKAGSQRHYEYLRDAVNQNCKTPCLGYMPVNKEIIMPERHLGLMTADELDISGKTLSTLVSMVEDHIDMDRLIRQLPEFIPKPCVMPRQGGQDSEKARLCLDGSSGPRIAVARDKAFCFYYRDNMEMLEAAGGDIVYFSPLADESLPEDIDGIYLGGGYPEVFAGSLAKKKGLLKEINGVSRAGMPVYGECGGFMYLCSRVSGQISNQLSDHVSKAGNQDFYTLSSCFDFDIQMSSRLRSLGYREITLTQDTLLGKKGEKIRGHEFHYSAIREPGDMDSGTMDQDVKNVYQVTSRAGQDISLKGFQKNNTLGSYLHVHFGSNPKAASHFVSLCRLFRQKRLKESSRLKKNHG